MNKVASSKAFGFGIFAIATWLSSMYMSGFIQAGYMMENPLQHVAVFATIGLLIAAIAAFFRRDIWLAFFFMLWTAVYAAGGGAMAAGWGWLAIALVNFYLAVAALKSDHGPVVALMVLLVAISALCEGLLVVVGLDLAGRIGGYFGLATALVAFHLSAKHVVAPDEADKSPADSS